MSFVISKEALYRQQENYASAKSHTIFASSDAAVASPTFTYSIPVADATATIDIPVVDQKYVVLDAYFCKGNSGAGAGDDVVVSHLDADGVTLTTVATFTAGLPFSGLVANQRADFPSMPNFGKQFGNGQKLRVVSTAGAGTCDGTVNLVIGLI